MGALLAVLVVTNGSDAVLRDPARTFAIPLALLLVGIPALLTWLYLRSTRAQAAPPAGGAVGGPPPRTRQRPQGVAGPLPRQDPPADSHGP